MSAASARPEPFALPRPGAVKAVGICHIVVASILIMGDILTCAWLASVVQQSGAEPGAKASMPVGVVSVGPGGATTSTSTSFTFDPMMGMNDPLFIRFMVIDIVTGLAVNGLMMAGGIGLLNLKRWANALWTWTAWIKIARLFLVWGFFLIAITPGLSERMAVAAVAMFRSSPMAPGRAPTVPQLTQVYSILCLVLGVIMAIPGSIYPAATLLILRRPGLRAALVGRTVAPPVELD